MGESIYWKPPHGFLIISSVVCHLGSEHKKLELGVRDGFSASQCSGKSERERISDKLCLGVEWSVWLSEMTAVSQLKLHSSYCEPRPVWSSASIIFCH